MIDPINTSESIHGGHLLRIGTEAITLNGIVHIPPEARGLVILAHGIDSGEDNHQNAILQSQAFYTLGLATVLVDLFTTEEQKLDAETGFFRANVEIMQQRFIGSAEWLLLNEETHNFSIGYFATDVSGAAALIAAAERPDIVRAVVAIGARLDMAQAHVARILAPTLLIAAEHDEAAIKMNQDVLGIPTLEKQFEQVKGATSLFESREVLNEVARLAGQWYTRWLVPIV